MANYAISGVEPSVRATEILVKYLPHRKLLYVTFVYKARHENDMPSEL
jgi:hypothetical protein